MAESVLRFFHVQQKIPDVIKDKGSRYINPNYLELTYLTSSNDPKFRFLKKIKNSFFNCQKTDKKFSLMKKSTNSTTIMDLPAEICCSIFQYLSASDVDSCRIVNKKFNGIINTNSRKLQKHAAEMIVTRQNNVSIVFFLLTKNQKKQKIFVDQFFDEKFFLLAKRIEITKLIIEKSRVSQIVFMKNLLEKKFWTTSCKKVEIRSNDWQSFFPILGSLLDNVKHLKIFDLTCSSTLECLDNELSMLSRCDVIFQIFGAVPSIFDLKRFLQIWTEKEKPIFFQEITFYFGINQIETNWFEYYPKLNIHRKDGLNLFGEFIDYNCLQLTMKPRRSIYRCLSLPITNNPPFQFFQNGLPVEFISVDDEKTYFTVKCSTSQCFAINICSTNPNEFKVYPATFFLHRSQILEIQFNFFHIFSNNDPKLYIEFTTSKNFDVSPIFLAHDFYPSCFLLPLKYNTDF